MGTSAAAQVRDISGVSMSCTDMGESNKKEVRFRCDHHQILTLWRHAIPEFIEISSIEKRDCFGNLSEHPSV